MICVRADVRFSRLKKKCYLSTASASSLKYFDAHFPLEGTLKFFESQRLVGKLLLISHNHVSIAVLIASVVLPVQSPSLAICKIYRRSALEDTTHGRRDAL